MNVLRSLQSELKYLNKCQLTDETGYSRSRIYEWGKEISDRKKREMKGISEEVANAAVEVIKAYPHFSAVKGQEYMIYHRLGYIPHHAYKWLKKVVKRVVFQEVSTRKLLPARTSYEHERPGKTGEIWAEDFGQIMVEGRRFYISLVIDVYSNYCLGSYGSARANDRLVELPIIQALDANEGRGPERFLLSDNGKQYVSNEHGELLDKLSIVQKRIPACKPEYNGSMECGMKEYKNVFYNNWADMEKNRTDKEKNLLVRVQEAIAETTVLLNNEIPRPCLKGVTPADVQRGVADEKREMNLKYLEVEKQKKVIQPLSKSIWELVKNAFKELSDLELMTKFCFFLKRPLRKLAKLKLEVSGN